VKGITISTDDHESFFKRRIHLFLANGYGVSVVYGTGIYSGTLNGERHGKLPPDVGNAKPEATSVEIAVIHPNGSFVPFTGGDEVRGWTDLDTVFKIVAWAAALPSATVTA
jgi:hypothetical protein